MRMMFERSRARNVERPSDVGKALMAEDAAPCWDEDATACAGAQKMEKPLSWRLPVQRKFIYMYERTGHKSFIRKTKTFMHAKSRDILSLHSQIDGRRMESNGRIFSTLRRRNGI